MAQYVIIFICTFASSWRSFIYATFPKVGLCAQLVVRCISQLWHIRTFRRVKNAWTRFEIDFWWYKRRAFLLFIRSSTLMSLLLIVSALFFTLKAESIKGDVQLDYPNFKRSCVSPWAATSQLDRVGSCSSWCGRKINEISQVGERVDPAASDCDLSSTSWPLPQCIGIYPKNLI